MTPRKRTNITKILAKINQSKVNFGRLCNRNKYFYYYVFPNLKGGGHTVLNANPVGVRFFSPLSFEPDDGFLSNLHRNIVGKGGRVD